MSITPKRINSEAFLNAILDNQTASDEVFIKAIEALIAKAQPFDHSSGNIPKACGVRQLSPEDFGKIDRSKLTCFSEEVEAMEKVFTKRELTLLATKAIHDAAEMFAESLSKMPRSPRRRDQES